MTVDSKNCPYCSEEIKATAIKCKHCSTMLGDTPAGTSPPMGTTGAGVTNGVVAAWAAGVEPIPPGTEISNYRVIRLLGAGGMGEVYLAEHTYTGQKVALKAVHPGLMSDQNVRRRFLEEGRVMADLKHPGIVTLHNFFEEQGRFFLVLEYVEGTTLGERLQGGPLAPAEASRICSELLSALQYAHTRPDPVIHRDIKPANIMLAADDRVVVMDFGIAKALGREKLTKTGGAIGTYEYMSPEQVQGGALSVTSDLYSVGIVLYQMLTGVVPFPQETDGGFEVMRAHVDIPPPPLSSRRPDAPSGFQMVLARALAKDPGQRHPDAVSFSLAVDAASQSRAEPIRHSAPVPSKPPSSGSESLSSTTDSVGVSGSDGGFVAPKALGLRWVSAVIILALVSVGVAAGLGAFEDDSATVSVKQVKKDEAAKAAEAARAAKAEADRSIAEANRAAEEAKARAKEAIAEETAREEAKAAADQAIAEALKAAEAAEAAEAELTRAEEKRAKEKRAEELRRAVPDRKVELQFYIMSQCPFAVQVMDGVIPALRQIGSEWVDFKVDYIGTIDGKSLASMHGDSEVKGDIVELCVFEHAPGKWMDFFQCVDKNYRDLPGNWTDCAGTAGFSSSETKRVKDCSTGSEGRALLRASFEKAKAAGARGSPTIHLDGQAYSGGRTERDFLVAICGAMSGGKATVCRELPAPIEVQLIVLSDKRCTDSKCDTAKVLGSLKGMFAGLDVTVYDWADRAAKKVFEDHGITLLPAYIFNAKVTEASGYERVKRYLRPTKVDGFLSMSVGSNHDPKAEICDNGIDDTRNGWVDCADETCKASLICRKEIPGKVDVFVMSQCPFAVKALDAMKDVLNAFKGEITFEVHYIATEDGDGFKALHGQLEVEENIRQVCVAEYYPSSDRFMKYIWCRNKDIRSDNWEGCVRKAGMDVSTIQSCSTGQEGKTLLRKDIKGGSVLGFSASPTWLANNKHKFSGLDAATIQKSICLHNKGLKGCKKTL